MEREPDDISNGDGCAYCGKRCRVALSPSMPRAVIKAYERAGLDSLATCKEGTLVEQRALGVSYADVIAERLARVPR